jgi:PAS domain S-box-containing protein
MANQELEKAKEQIEAIMEYSPDAFMLLDAETNIQIVNPSFTKMLGNLPEDVYGKPLMHIVHDVNYELIESLLNAVLESKQAQLLDFKAIHTDGSTFDCALAITPIIEDDQIAGMVINLHDISTQVEVQRMKDAFVSNVSHELRTPITNFICNLELIRMNPEKQDIYLGRLEQEIVQLKNIIEDLLRLSRFDQEAVPLQKIPIDINQLCEDFTSLRTPLADQKNLSLAFIPHEGLPRITGDYGLISQVLSILLTNAINYTQVGGEIIIRSHASDESHPDMIGFSVSDNGPGIAAEDIDKIFDRFYRGQAGHDSNVSGTGLGLPIAHEIISRHGGKIEVFSNGEVKKGAKFMVWLPIDSQIGA